MSRRIKIGAALVALAAVGGALAFVAFGGGGAAVEVETATVERADISVTVTASGEVESGTRADVFPPVAGLIAEVRVREGQAVSRGTVLAVLDTGPLELAVAQARSAVAQAESALAAVADQAPTSADVAAARAATDAAWASYRSALTAADSVADQLPSRADKDAAAAATRAAEKAYERAEGALAAANAAFGAAPTPENAAAVQTAEAARDQAHAALLNSRASAQRLASVDLTGQQAAADAAAGQARAAYLGAKAQQDRLDRLDLSQERRAANGAVEQAREALALADENLRGAELVAPIDGVVLFNPLGAPGADGAVPKAAPGAGVAPQAAPFAIVRLDSVRFVAEVDEADIDLVEEGMSAVVRLDAFAEQSFESSVSVLMPAATLTVTGGTVFPVKVSLSGVEERLLIGMKGDATIEVSRRNEVTRIPIEALFDEGGESFVYVVEENRLVRTPVEVGVLTETSAEIVSGVAPGSEVALSSATEFADGMPVRVR